MDPGPFQQNKSNLPLQLVALSILLVLATSCTATQQLPIMKMHVDDSVPYAEDTRLNTLEGKHAAAASRYYRHRHKRQGTVQDCLENEVAYICTGSCLTKHQRNKYPHGFLQMLGFRHYSLVQPHGCTIDGQSFIEPAKGNDDIGMEYMKFAAERGSLLRKGKKHVKILLHTFSISCPFTSDAQAQQLISRAGMLSKESAPAVLWEVRATGTYFRAPVYNVRHVNTENAKGVGMMAGPVFGNIDLKGYFDYYKTRWNVDRFYIYTSSDWESPDPKWYEKMVQSGTFTSFRLTTPPKELYYHGQVLAQNIALWDAKSEFKYLLCFDPDEFLDWNFPPPPGISVETPLLSILNKLNGSSNLIPWITYEIDGNMVETDRHSSALAAPEGFRPLQYPFDTSTRASICYWQGKPIIRTRVSYYSAVHHTYQKRTEQKIFSLGHYRSPIDILEEHSGNREMPEKAFVRVFPSVGSCEAVLDWWDRKGRPHPPDWVPPEGYRKPE